MEKIILPLWREAAQPKSEFFEQLQGPLLKQLSAIDNILSIKFCLDDEHVEQATSFRCSNIYDGGFDAVLFLWVNTASRITHITETIATCTNHFYAYLVTESEPLKNSFIHVASGRSEGMNQVVFLQKPAKFEYTEWLNIWLMQHTQIAIDTQSTYAYRQNVVVRALTANSPAIDGIVEENFPEEAITSKHAFYAAEGNELLAKEHENAMLASCMRFIDFERMECLPMSEYILV